MLDNKMILAPASVNQARRIFFDEGRQPEGLVGDAVWRSWQRCSSNGLRDSDKVVYQPLLDVRVGELIERNRHLIAAAQPTFQQLAHALSGNDYGLLLTDPFGTAVAVHGPVANCNRMIRDALRLGVDLSERCIGTSAMAVAMAEEQPVAVLGAEHFFLQNLRFQCVAAPIFGPDGRLVGSIDFTRDTPLPRFGALSLMRDSAAAIETALFLQQRAPLTICLHWNAGDGARSSQVLLSFGIDGEVLGASRAARTLLELADVTDHMHFDDVFQGGYARFRDGLNARRGALDLSLHSGLRVYASVVGAPPRAAVPAPVTPARQAGGLPEFGDPEIAAALHRSLRALKAGLPVLLLGETGTGKEVAARALHEHSSASDGPFIAINCGAIPRELIEGELFGYADGAYTGARRGGAKGRIEEANGGTLFLDEIGDMPLELQTRLLRVLENREVSRLGESRTRKLDFQLVSATHQDLAAQVQEQRFRSDLYFRLSGMQLCLPPLRRRADLGELVDVLLGSEGIASGRLSKQCRAVLLRYDWPGNARELRTALRYANAMAEPDEMLEVEHLPELVRRGRPVVASVHTAGTTVLKESNDEMIQRALEQAGGNVSNAARQLGISRATLHRWRNRQR